MAKQEDLKPEGNNKPKGLDRILNTVEFMGNKLPDPAILFLIAMLSVWVLSAIMLPVHRRNIRQ